MTDVVERCQTLIQGSPSLDLEIHQALGYSVKIWQDAGKKVPAYSTSTDVVFDAVEILTPDVEDLYQGRGIGMLMARGFDGTTLCQFSVGRLGAPDVLWGDQGLGKTPALAMSAALILFCRMFLQGEEQDD